MVAGREDEAWVALERGAGWVTETMAQLQRPGLDDSERRRAEALRGAVLDGERRLLAVDYAAPDASARPVSNACARRRAWRGTNGI